MFSWFQITDNIVALAKNQVGQVQIQSQFSKMKEFIFLHTGKKWKLNCKQVLILQSRIWARYSESNWKIAFGPVDPRVRTNGIQNVNWIKPSNIKVCFCKPANKNCLIFGSIWLSWWISTISTQKASNTNTIYQNICFHVHVKQCFFSTSCAHSLSDVEKHIPVLLLAMFRKKSYPNFAIGLRLATA